MSKSWNERGAAERRRLEAAFVLRHGAELLLHHDAEEESPIESGRRATRGRPSLACLYGSLSRPGPLSDEVCDHLAGDPRLREDFALLLRRTARHYVPRAAAAAGRGVLQSRKAGEFRLRIVESRASSEQVYLLVELPDRMDAAPERLVVRAATGEFLKRDLPPPESGTVRLVLTADDPLVLALGEPASEVFLW